jgi:sterol desaturase/sphingolipid hydroxylase (fatty acid hydroxylase superfamily)
MPSPFANPPPFLWLVPVVAVAAATAEGVWLTRRRSYDWRAYWASLGDALLRGLTRLLPIGVGYAWLQWCWQHRVQTLSLDGPLAWAALFVAVEFLYYWLHRADHRIRWLWATHAVHHSPEELTLASAYRLGFTMAIEPGAFLFSPLVVLGVPPLAVLGMLAANLLYQFWIHNTWMPRLGPLEWVLNTPTHHRVHHASNPEYLDRNFGGVLIVFDRLFGTFQAPLDGVPLRFGLTTPVRSYDPVRVGLHAWRALFDDLHRARGPRAAAAVLFGPPR